MQSLSSILESSVRAITGIDPEIRSATKPQFGHFQSNVALRLAKSQGRNPREVAKEIVSALEIADICEPLEIAGPGFINFKIKPSVLAQMATEVRDDPHNGISISKFPQRVVIDYSSPNVAKQMHVGHLRSTIIGDCFNRILTELGHTVIAQNHIGDWGRQFGMLVEQILDEKLNLDNLDLPALEDLYQRANTHVKNDENFAIRARDRVVKLQSGDEETLKIWQRLIDISLEGFNKTYKRMNVLLTDDDIAGESIYNDSLAWVCEDLQSRGIATEDDGALVIFLDGFKSPVIIRNQRGGYGYSTTDLAAIRYRVDKLKAGRIIYIVGTPQTLHFQQVFTAARIAGYLPDSVTAEHVGFGQVLGADGKKFSTREGTAVPLNDLLDQAEYETSPNIALAAIKYADLASGLQKDYVFDVERMVQTTGDTGPYLQYAHARTCQILRKAQVNETDIGAITQLAEVSEQELALLITKFGETVEEVAQNLTPHKLCTYLYDLAGALSKFYDACPVLKSEGSIRASRLALCDVTRRVLAKGLYLLGIDAPERM